MSNNRTKDIRVRVGNYEYPVTVLKTSKGAAAIFYNGILLGIPTLELPENWNREMIRKHIEKYLNK